MGRRASSTRNRRALLAIDPAVQKSSFWIDREVAPTLTHTMSAAYELHAGDRAPAPFLKWAGGKGQLLHEILPRLPARIARYHEPFVGGGAVFFALAAEERFDEAIIADKNPALVEAYRVVKTRVD